MAERHFRRDKWRLWKLGWAGHKREEPVLAVDEGGGTRGRNRATAAADHTA